MAGALGSAGSVFRAGAYTVRFVSSYRGESDYAIAGPGFEPGARLHVRTTAERDRVWCSPDVFEREIRPLVGTVRLSWSAGVFPPADVLALFPGFVGARWLSGGGLEFQAAPAQWVGSTGIVWAEAWRAELLANGVELLGESAPQVSIG